MSREQKMMEQLREEVSVCIQEGTALSLERARTLLNHQQLLLRQLINEHYDQLRIEELAMVEAKFMEASEKLLDVKVP